MNCKFFSIILLLLPITALAAWQNENNTIVELQNRHFWQEHQFADQANTYSALTFEYEWLLENDAATDQLVITPYLRLDANDSQHTYADLNELLWLHVSESWETRVGITRVFWGVVETQRLVDVINQRHAFDGDYWGRQLGQPLANLTLELDYGLLDIFVLAGFREKITDGLKARLRPSFIIEDSAKYDVDNVQQQLDTAIRYSTSIGANDIALSVFQGTNRQPQIINEQGKFYYYYRYMQQLGLEFVNTGGDLIYKLEIILRHEQDQDSYYAATGGLEYNVVGAIAHTDINLLMEYSDVSTANTQFFENTLLYGMRMVFNDVQASELFVAVDHKAEFIRLSAARRLGDKFKATINANLYQVAHDDVAAFLNKDHYIDINLSYYF